MYYASVKSHILIKTCTGRIIKIMQMMWAPPENGGGVQQPFLRTPSDGIPPSNRHLGPLVDWWPPTFNQQVSHLHGSRPQIHDL